MFILPGVDNPGLEAGIGTDGEKMGVGHQLVADFLVQAGIQQGDEHKYFLPLGRVIGFLQESADILSFGVSQGRIHGHVDVLLSGIITKPVLERLPVGVVAVNHGHVRGTHRTGCANHDFTLGDVTFRKKPRIGFLGVDALQFHAGASGHQNRQTVLARVAKNVLRVVGIVRADYGMAGIGAFLGMGEFVSEGIQIFRFFIVITQVQPYGVVHAVLGQRNGVLGHFYTPLPLLLDFLGQNDIDIQNHFFLGILRG